MGPRTSSKQVNSIMGTLYNMYACENALENMWATFVYSLDVKYEYEISTRCLESSLLQNVQIIFSHQFYIGNSTSICASFI